MNGVLPVESLEDKIKREKRSFEFSTRISRNYLYQLGRQIIDLRKHVKPNGKHVHNILTVNQKFINAHQIVLQAVQAFCNYIPQSIVVCIKNKFEELLFQICELCKLTKSFRIFNNINSHYAVVEVCKANIFMIHIRNYFQN